MRRSIVLLVLVSIVFAALAGCVPNADRGPVAFTPRTQPYLPQLQPPETLMNK
jgi:hypothetical protein